MKTQAPLNRKKSANGSPAKGRVASAEAPKRVKNRGLSLRRVVVPTDFSEESQKALVYAVALAQKFDASIELVFVVEPVSFFTGLDQTLLTVSNEEAAEAARKKLIKMAQNAGGGELHLNPKVRIGKPYLEICALAREYNADLIIISTHGYTGVKHTVLGSVAERVVRHAPCPVLIVRENEHDFVNL